MPASGRRRDWNPPAIFEECPECELTKPTEPLSATVLSFLSVLTLPVSKINAPSASIPLHDPEQIPPVDGPIDEGWGFGSWSNVSSVTAGGAELARKPRAAGVSCLQKRQPDLW
jgi:hypothetical protein